MPYPEHHTGPVREARWEPVYRPLAFQVQTALGVRDVMMETTATLALGCASNGLDACAWIPRCPGHPGGGGQGL